METRWNARLLKLPSPALGRSVYLWCYGHYGPPLVAFPTAGGYAHEWQMHGMVETLGDLLEAGRLKLYCPETNVSQAWLSRTIDDPLAKLAAHQRYERFVVETLVPFVREDCRTPDIPLMTAGASLGASYASLLALKHPDVFSYALCLSGRYELSFFLDGYLDEAVAASNPLTLAPRRADAALAALQRTHLALVCGRGPYEERCIDETLALADVCAARGIPHTRDIWGRDVAHTWGWWRRQARHHLVPRLAGNGAV